MSSAATWLPEGFIAPPRLDLPTGHHLRQIRASDIDIDYPAVMGSRHRLWEMFGEKWGWPPATMTKEEDLVDLRRHEDEMRINASFNYAILDAAETALLGCVYIDPPQDAGVDAEVAWWVVDEMVGSPLERALEDAMPRWIGEEWSLARPRFRGGTCS